VEVDGPVGCSNGGSGAAPPSRRSQRVRVAYLASRYPAISHAFIQREIDALRERDVEIHTFSIHRSSPDDVLTERDRESARTTFALSPPRWRPFLRAHLVVLARHPRAYLKTLYLAVRLPGDSLPTRMRYFFGAVVIWVECRRRAVRHVHAHFTSPAADVAQVVAELGRRQDDGHAWSWSFTAHGTDIFNDQPMRLAEKIRRADSVVCVSDFGRSQIMSRVDEVHWKKLRVVRCGVDRAWLARNVRPAPDGRLEPLRVLTVGRIEREKGHHVLLEALASLKRRNVRVRWTLVGDGSLRLSVWRRAVELGLESEVALLGKVGQDRIRSCYLDAHVFCLPSLGEGVPVVLMEAMASGLPVVASGIMGIPELVEAGVGGLLVPPGRADALAEAIGILAADPALRRRMGRAGRERVEVDYDIGRSAGSLRAIFDLQPGQTGDETAASPGNHPCDEAERAPVAGAR
jgi:glycosyltransferase involved in cell wall biosynthesis